MKRAVIYARYSSEKQNEQSIDGQIRVCKKFAEDNDIEIINIYTDKALSGRTDNRPGFKKMIADSYKQNFDFVIVYKLDRFSRNRYDSAVNKSILKKNNVKLLSAMENITDSPEGIILESLLEGLAEYYSAELAQKIKRGRIDSFKKGLSLGGGVPFGYKIENRKYVIDEDKREVVEFVFAKYSTGTPPKDIIKALKEKGFKFTPTNIQRMVSNKKYIGIYEFNGEEVKNYIPAIVSKEVFMKSQKFLEKHKKSPASAKAKVNYLLSGKLFCGYCNKIMFGESGVGRNGTVYNYYKCSTNKKTATSCEMKTYKKDYLEKLVIDATQNYIFAKENYNNLINNVVKVHNRELENDSTLNLLKDKLNATNKEIENIIRIVKTGKATDSILEELKKLEDEKKELELSIMQNENKFSFEMKREHIEFWFDQFKNISADDTNSMQYLVEAFINKIIVFNDKIRIVYNSSNNNEKDIPINELECLLSDTTHLVDRQGLEPWTH